MMIMDKILTKENIIIAVAVFVVIIQSNYFATRLDLANLKLELKDYISTQDGYIENKVDKKLDNMDKKLDLILKAK